MIILGLIRSTMRDDSPHMWAYLTTWGLLVVLILTETILMRVWARRQEKFHGWVRSEILALWRRQRPGEAVHEVLRMLPRNKKQDAPPEFHPPDME